jgi:hypothetical protein
MTTVHRDSDPHSGQGDLPRGLPAKQLRAKRWMVALTAVLVAVPVGATAEQLAVHGKAFFICRGPAVGATDHKAADCPEP